MKTGRLLFASIHCYLDPSSGAALATRELLESLAARGWDCRALTCGILDYQRETRVDEVLKVLELEGSARRLNADARARRGRGGGRPDARRRARHGDAHGLQPGRAGAQSARGRAVPRPGRQVLDRFRPDVMLTYGGHAVSLELMRRARAGGTPVVFHLHNFGYNDRRGFADASAVLFPSEYSRRDHCAGSGWTGR